MFLYASAGAEQSGPICDRGKPFRTTEFQIVEKGIPHWNQRTEVSGFRRIEARMCARPTCAVHVTLPRRDFVKKPDETTGAIAAVPGILQAELVGLEFIVSADPKKIQFHPWGKSHHPWRWPARDGNLSLVLRMIVLCYFSHMRNPPRKAFRLLPSRVPGGSFFSFLLFPPPSTT
jgi:hypothetical protein